MAGKTGITGAKTYALVLLYLTLYLILVIPVVLLLFCPFYIFRGLLSQLRKVFRKDLDKLIHTRSSVLARENWSEEPQWNLVVWLTQEGLMDLDKFRKDFYNNYVLRKGPDGELLYPEYQQHYSKWMGFLFWRWEDSFDIKEHIRPYDGLHQEEETVDRKGLMRIIKELTWKGWHPRKSPWEFLQIPNYRENGEDKVKTSLLIYRIHHGLGDGYYILKLVTQDIGGVGLEKALGKPKYARRNFLQTIALGALYWIRAPYQMVEMLVTAEDTNDWHLPMDKIKKPMNAALTEPIDLGLIKSIKNYYNVSFSAVIYAALTGGIRNMMLERGVEVPSEIHTAIAVPIPGHSFKLRNNFIFSFVELPIGISDPVRRLIQMDKNYTSLRKSSAPRLNFEHVPLFGALPAWMIKPMCINWVSTCLVSNFPGTPEYTFSGVKVLDMMFNAGLGEGSVGFGFCLISYIDHITLISQVDPGILPTDADVERLNEKIIEEMKTFQKLASL